MPPDNALQITPLRAFVAVAELGSLASAARTLGYTEPAVHLQLAKLKRAAGGELFRRTPKRMLLTPLGVQLLPHALAALGAVDRISTEIAAWQAKEGHVLRVGLGRSAGVYLFPYAVAAVQKKCPQVVLEPTTLPLDDLVAALKRRELDLVIVSGLSSRKSRANQDAPLITATPLVPYYWTLVSTPRTADELAIRNRGRSPLRIFVPDYFRPAPGRGANLAAGLGSVTLERLPSAEAARTSALAGRGPAYLPNYACGLELASGALVQCGPNSLVAHSTVDVGHIRPREHPDVAPVVRALRGLRGLFRDDSFASSRH